jgi:hypothetical protein
MANSCKEGTTGAPQRLWSIEQPETPQHRCLAAWLRKVEAAIALPQKHQAGCSGIVTLAPCSYDYRCTNAVLN